MPPIAPTPQPPSRNACANWPLGRLALLALCALLGMARPGVVSAMSHQAPNSRVVLDLPPGYVPSPLFAGFQNDETGASYVILEAPAGEYDKMAAGLNAEELGKRGITGIEKGTLQRAEPYVYMRAHQKSAAGAYDKFFVLFRTFDQTVLISVNVPEHAIEDGSVKVEEIDNVLATAKTTDKPAIRDLYTLSYLGPFKEAGTLVGTSKIYTLDGRLEPERAGVTRSAFMVAPSLDKRPVEHPAQMAASLLAGLPGYRDFRLVGEARSIRIGGLDGVEVEAEAVDEDDDKAVHLYQAMLLGADGGYFRLIGIAAPDNREQMIAEFPKIAHSFALQ